MAYQIGDAIFVGDALLMPDLGTGRCDLFSGDAAQLGVVQNTVTDFWLIDNCAPFLSHENNDEIILQ